MSIYKNTNKNEKELLAILGLSAFPYFGPASFRKLKTYFSNYLLAWQAEISELIQAGITEKSAYYFKKQQKQIYPEKILTSMEREKIKIIFSKDKLWPVNLFHTKIKYPFLFYKGELPPQTKKNLAIIGARKHTAYGESALNKIIDISVINNTNIISGLALGIDGLAHQKTLQYNGYTLAVIGSGLLTENIYPREHKYLAEKIIASGGGIISQFSPLAKPEKKNFPERNYLIAALSTAIFVIEAGIKSGSLITATQARKEGKLIFTIPGNIFSSSQLGNNQLLENGAIAISSSEQLLKNLKIKALKNKIFQSDLSIKQLSEIERNIYFLLQNGSKPFIDLSKLSNYSNSQLNTVLSLLEIKGLIKKKNNSYFLV